MWHASMFDRLQVYMSPNRLGAPNMAVCYSQLLMTYVRTPLQMDISLHTLVSSVLNSSYYLTQWHLSCLSYWLEHK